jgi:flagellin-like protein
MHKFSKIWLRLAADQRGITGLETAIVLIAFVVVAAVFAFTVLTTGLFTSKEAEKASRAALTSAEATLVHMGTTIAGGAFNAGGSQAIDWSNCPDPTDPPAPAPPIPPYDNSSAACLAHAQLIRFKLTPGGKESVFFDPAATQIWWHDTGSGRRNADPPVSEFVPLFQTTPLGPSETDARACVGDTRWCFRWQQGETDRTLESGEYVEIFIGASGGVIHQLEKNTLFTIEVIPQDGAVVMINGKMPGVIMQVNDTSR